MKNYNKSIILALIILQALFSSCDNTPKDIRLAFEKSGNVSVVGNHSYLVSKIGPMAQNVSKVVKEPERGMTRLIVRDTRLPSDRSDNIFDIKFASTLDIKGAGQYRFNKESNTNIWLLEINGNDVQELTILEGSPSNATNYPVMGMFLIILGIILLIVGIPTIPAFGSGCIISIIGVLLIYLGYYLRQPA